MALGYLSEIERGAKELSSELLNELTYKGMGVEASEMVARAALLMVETTIPDTADAFLRKIENYSGATI